MPNQPYILNNERGIPRIGFGTFRTPNGKQTEQSVLDALRAGYRLIDCAAVYGNETSVGAALERSGVPRAEIFLTSKLWNDEKGYDKTIAAFENTLCDLHTDYLDLYLIHWPIARATRANWQQANNETWRAFEDLYKDGKAKAIGVSNFMPHHFAPLLEKAQITPMVNQIEFHPGMRQEETLAFCAAHGIVAEAWAPFANGALLRLPALAEIGARYEKTPAQVCLRWIIQKGVVPLPKSVTPARIRSNFDVFDFTLTEEDVAAIDRLNDCGHSGLHPDLIDF